MSVTTFYPSLDGQVYVDGKTTWTLARDVADGDGAADSATDGFLQSEKLAASNYAVHRFFYLFDTSSIPDTDVISAADLGVYNMASSSGTMDIGLIQTSPASTSALAVGDFDAMTVNSPTEGATRVSSFTNNTYFVFTLNASGISWISKTGISKFGIRMANDIDNTEPTSRYYRQLAFSETSGTSNDPYLTVTYAPAAGRGSRLAMLGVA